MIDSQNEAKRWAAWALYVELKTRITTQTLNDDLGLLREALNSLYSLFGSTREILIGAGSDVGEVGDKAIALLNNHLRPFLSKWHPVLSEWEAQSPNNERDWSEAPKLRKELRVLSDNLADYVTELEGVFKIKKFEPGTVFVVLRESKLYDKDPSATAEFVTDIPGGWALHEDVDLRTEFETIQEAQAAIAALQDPYLVIVPIANRASVL